MWKQPLKTQLEIMSNWNAIFSLCEASREAQFKPDVTSFFVGWCLYENFRSLLPRPWDNPNTRNGARLRSPSPIMAPDRDVSNPTKFDAFIKKRKILSPNSWTKGALLRK